MRDAVNSATVALVTGSAGGGIGTHTALALARAGYPVAIHGRTRSSVNSVVETIAAEGGLAAGFVADLSDSETVAPLVSAVRQDLGPIGILVHNAAAGVTHRVVENLSLQDWRQDQSVILEAAFLISAQVLPDMRALNWGRIVYVSSSSALRGSYGRAASYAAAKAGLVGLAAQNAIEYGPHGVTINVVAPSQIDTPRIRRNDRRNNAQLTERGASIPLRRVGLPENVADTIAFLCSPAAGYLTGTVLPIDGGSRLAGSETKARLEFVNSFQSTGKGSV